MKKFIVMLLVLAVLGAGGYFGYRYVYARQTPEEAAASMQMFQVTRGTISAQIDAVGNIAASAEVGLGFDSGGRVTEILVSEGDTVTAGQVLAKLEADDLNLQIAQAESSLAVSKQQLAQLLVQAEDYDIAAAQAALESAQASYDETLEGPSEAEIAAAEASLRSVEENYQDVLAGPDSEDITAARTSLESAEAELARLEAGYTEDELTVAKANLKKAEIAVQEAQTAYDEVAWQNNVGMSAQASALEQATIAYEAALADYNIALDGYSDREILSAMAQVDQAAATLADLLKQPTAADIAAAEYQVAQAKVTLENLLEQPTAAEIAAVKSQVAQAQSTLAALLEDADDHDIAIAQEQVRQAEISLEQARQNKEDITLKAPSDGVIVSLVLDVGEFVASGTEVAQLASLHDFYIDVYVDEIDIGQVAVGQKVKVELDAFDDIILPGHIAYIAPTSTEADSGVISYRVTVVLEETELAIREGMTADVAIITAQATDVLMLPHQALQTNSADGTTFVNRASGMGQEPEIVTVETGMRDETYTEIVSGLEEGDRVILTVAGTSGSTSEDRPPGMMMGGMMGGGSPPGGGRGPQ